MARRSRPLLVALALMASALFACGDNLKPTDGIDAAELDAAVIDGPPIDAPTDARIDAPTDARIDAPIDAQTDASPVNQIQDARTTPDGAGLMLPIDGVYVTYLKPAIGSDPAGFTIQASMNGPALFIAVNPTTLTPPPVVGDRVSFTITAMGTAGMLRQATSITGFMRLSQGFDVNMLDQDLSAAMDVVGALATYESELVDLTATLNGVFVGAGSMFEEIQLTTVGYPTSDPNLKLRVPTALRDSLDLVSGCRVVLNNTPLGRFDLRAQFAAFTAGDLTLSMCPAPTVVSANPTTPTSVVITFSRRILPGSVNANGSQFTFNNGLTASAAQVSGRTVIVTTSAQAAGTTYTVTVANTVTDQQGTVLGLPNMAMFPGFVTPAVVRINEINANVASGCDLIELRVVTGGTLLNLRLAERTGIMGNNELNLQFPAAVVPTNAIIVVHLSSGVAACNPGGATAETTGPMQQPLATFPNNFDTAYDFWNVDTGLTATDNVFTLFAPNGQIQDVFFGAQAATGTAAAATETAAATAAMANQWQMVGGGVPPGGFIDDTFRAHAALDLDGTGTSASGTSIQRLDNTDTNDKEDWNTAGGVITVQANTFGILNVGQTPF